MSLAPNSMGFGHGGFGTSYFGNGPWVTFPYTPGFTYATTYTHDVDPHGFDDLTEQRYLRAGNIGRTLTYDFSTLTDSAIIAAVTSWWLAAGGPATRFSALDHTTSTAYLVRIADLLGTQRAALRRALDVLHFHTEGPNETAGTIGFGGESTGGFGEGAFL